MMMMMIMMVTVTVTRDAAPDDAAHDDDRDGDGYDHDATADDDHYDDDDDLYSRKTSLLRIFILDRSNIYSRSVYRCFFYIVLSSFLMFYIIVYCVLL